MDHLNHLLTLIDRVLARELSPSQFEGQYALYWYEHVPVDVMRSSAAGIYSGVVEKLEFVKAHPSDLERRDGWIDEQQFLSWLSVERRKLFQVS